MKLDRNQLAGKLNVKLEGLKKIESRNQLENRLSKIGYKLIKKIKDSRKVFYEVEEFKEQKQLASNICKHVFNTNKPNEFTKYFKERTYNSKNNLPATLEHLSNRSNVSIATVHKWDLKLLHKKIISKDGFFYFKLNRETSTIEEITIEEYKSFWKNKGRLKLYKSLQNKYLKGEITFQEALEISDNAVALRLELSNRYLYRIKRYKLNQENSLYNDFINLIESK